ncbi:MAG: hypothetical protein ACR2RV_03735 [Verrucomicrobiales bacterium]
MALPLHLLVPFPFSVSLSISLACLFFMFAALRLQVIVMPFKLPDGVMVAPFPCLVERMFQLHSFAFAPLSEAPHEMVDCGFVATNRRLDQLAFESMREVLRGPVSCRAVSFVVPSLPVGAPFCFPPALSDFLALALSAFTHLLCMFALLVFSVPISTMFIFIVGACGLQRPRAHADEQAGSAPGDESSHGEGSFF